MLKRKDQRMEPWEISIILCKHELKTDSSFMILCRFEQEAHSYYT